MINHMLERLLKGEALTEQQMIFAMDEIMEGKVSDVLISSFLTSLRVKGESIDEISGGAKTMRKRAPKVNFGDRFFIDTCGTGGSGENIYNISTAAAFICAAAGVPVLKYGNRAISSKSGSADVLEKLGCNINLSPEEVKKCLDELNIGFLFAPNFHKDMEHVTKVRKNLGFRTIFNILGPLINPADVKGQLLGVFNENLTEIMAGALNNLGVEHALVVHGKDGLDEITVSDKTKVTELKNKKLNTYYIEPENFGIESVAKKHIRGGTPSDNAKIITDIFNGNIEGPKKDILLLNAGAALYVGQKVDSIKSGVELAKEIIKNKKAKNKLEDFITFTNIF